MRVVFHGCSHIGAVREENEDAILMCTADNAALFLIADGVGGKMYGGEVSRMLREGYRRWWDECLLPALDQNSFRFSDALASAKEVLANINHAAVEQFGMWTAGSTVALFLRLGEYCAVLSCGDSRVYRVRGMRICQITVDDVIECPAVPNCAVQEKLTRAIGVSDRLEYHLKTDVLRSGDRFFLCSDGVHHYISNIHLQKLLLNGRFLMPERIVARICRAVEQNGAGDNYSMILVKLV